MARIMCSSRRFCLTAAFLCVMAGTGGLIGAIGGVVLMLLSHTVLGLASSIAALMSASIGVGAIASVLLGVFLTARPSLRLAFQPRIASASRPEGQ